MKSTGVALARAREALLAWYRASRRDLPWRRTRDPYAIWISEAMLQQTRVETVLGYYARFLERFPNVEALATAELEEVYERWAGLGYYSRARNLHAAARVIRERFGGALPDDAERLRELPGVGRYTAGAIASIAFDRPTPILDGNVERVLSRFLGVRDDVKQAATAERLWKAAAELAHGPAPGDLNQALMELGALVCTPRAPGCDVCPIAAGCDARARGDAESLPARTARATPRAVTGVAAWIERRGRVLAVRRAAGGLLGGLWELPGGDVARGEKPRDALERALRERLGLALESASPAGAVEHVFTHRRLRLHLFRAEVAAGRLRRDGYDAHRWLEPAALEALARSALTRKAVARARGAAAIVAARRRRT
ncbi:MAG TPA: A/G-specific adenine glycosylase [Myxococcota bacterium]|nr:A/G-specific adenine glycosylase [Myxococcota bacterium]